MSQIVLLSCKGCEKIDFVNNFSFTQLVSNIRPGNMKKLQCKHCPIPGWHSKFLLLVFFVHLTQVPELSEMERKYWLQFSKLQNTNAIRVYDKEAEPKTIFSIN